MKQLLRLIPFCVMLVFLCGLFTRGCGSQAESTVPETTPPETTAPETTAPAPSCPLPLDDWRMLLVNKDNPVPEDFPEPELTKVGDRFYVDVRCAEDLNAMLAACEADGFFPVVRSAYRTMIDQRILFENKVERLRNQGLSEDQAYLEAQTVVALPGTSEHHTGLALDLVDYFYQDLDEDQEQTDVQQWLLENCWDYGFILRYPNDKTEITGIIYEPWHYRYVGREVAADIRDSGLCYEEYLAQFGS